MAFKLNEVVPWGRNLGEYKDMFALTEGDLSKKIISFGDGPASFNAEMNELGKQVISLDPIYQFSKKEIQNRIDETTEVVINQTLQNKENFVWKNIKNIDELRQIRSKAMFRFLNDFNSGKTAGRYLSHALPDKTPFSDNYFDLGLSSHFLLLYSQLGLKFHVDAITEMIRICSELRIFPILNLDAKRSELLDDILNHFSHHFTIELVSVNFEFQKNGNQMLRIKK